MLYLPDSPPSMRTLVPLDDAYERCRQVTEKYAKTFYLATLLMPEVKRRGIWAIYAWCRRTDELVDGPGAKLTTPETLDQWERQLESVFAGEPQDVYDVALVDTVQRFQMEIQPFRDMIAGQRMDLYRSRYNTFEELNLYCYRVAGTVGLMSTAIVGLDEIQHPTPWKPQIQPAMPTQEAIALGIANQLTNILRDVGEDARRGRIYIPLEDLELFGYSEEELFQGVVNDRWRAVMQFQIQRARKFYADAEKGISALSRDARFPVWAALMLYSQILDAIERNQYDVFTRRAFVPTFKKFLCLPSALARAVTL
ncbi:MAG: phytoene synthase [Cyanobacteria bacterium]|nr:phytoene synthase [Cyanobacteriota bacterium]MDW8203244.1 phytoene synthase [Cyanobacteriota bacterium SKYGB_h_bin112]